MVVRNMGENPEASRFRSAMLSMEISDFRAPKYTEYDLFDNPNRHADNQKEINEAKRGRREEARANKNF